MNVHCKHKLLKKLNSNLEKYAIFMFLSIFIWPRHSIGMSDGRFVISKICRRFLLNAHINLRCKYFKQKGTLRDIVSASPLNSCQKHSAMRRISWSFVQSIRLSRSCGWISIGVAECLEYDIAAKMRTIIMLPDKNSSERILQTVLGA